MDRGSGSKKVSHVHVLPTFFWPEITSRNESIDVRRMRPSHLGTVSRWRVPLISLVIYRSLGAKSETHIAGTPGTYVIGCNWQQLDAAGCLLLLVLLHWYRMFTTVLLLISRRLYQLTLCWLPAFLSFILFCYIYTRSSFRIQYRRYSIALYAYRARTVEATFPIALALVV